MSTDSKWMGVSGSKSFKEKNRCIFSSSAVKLFIVDFLLLFFTYGGFYRSVFGNSDALWGALDPSSTFVARLGSNRWIPAIFELIYNSTGFIPAKHFRLSLFLFILALTVSLFIVQIIFLDLFERICCVKEDCSGIRMAVVAAATLPFVNVLFTEFFYFTESFHIFAFAFLFMAAGFYELSKKHIIVSFLLFCCMTMCYQMACPIASICIGVYVYLEHRGVFSLELVKAELIKALPPMILFVLNYTTGGVIQRIITMAGIETSPSKKISTGYSMREYIASITVSVKGLISSNIGLTPGVYVPFLVFVLTFTVVTFICIKKQKWNQLGTFFLVEIILVVLTLAVQIAENPANFVARTVTPLYFAQGMQILIMFFFISENHDSDNLVSGFVKILYLLPTLYILFNVFFVQCIIQNRMVSETLDGLYAESIFNKIEKYEQENGIIVKKIAPVNDTDSSPFYDQVKFCSGAINRRCYSDYTWTFLQYCAYETDLAGSLFGRSFERIAMDEDTYKELFEGKNWTRFDIEEQVIIRGDTVYICVF